LSDREGVAIWIPEVGDVGSTLECGDALLVCGYRSFVVALEVYALRGEFVNDLLNVVDVPAGQSRRRLAGVLRREINVHHAPLRTPILHVVVRVDAHRET